MKVIFVIIILCLILSLTLSLSLKKPDLILGLLVSVKNEGMVITEFIKHYLWQGVDMIYIIDNGSTDDTFNKLEPFIEQGRVQYFYRSKPYSQIKHYKEIYGSIRQQCQWVIVCDADEYIYNRTPGKTIKDYVSNLPYDKVAAIYLKWKMFGSNGYLQQPSSIRKSFTKRARKINDHTKVISNTSHVYFLDLHNVKYNSFKKAIHEPPELALNHYAIMSLEYFRKIKMTRGDATTIKFDSVRDENYFKKYDTNEVIDDELANLLQ